MSAGPDRDLFAGLRLERAERDDGRYVLYYSWSHEGQEAEEQAEPASREAVDLPAGSTPEAGPGQQGRPWSPESGPAEDPHV